MAQKWNLQDIRPATAKREPPPKEALPRKAHQDIAARPKLPPDIPVEDPELSTIDIIDGNKTRRKRVFVTSAVVALVLAFGFGVNVLLSGAEVVVYPKVKDVFVQAEFTAEKNPQVAELGYELLTLEATGERQVKASGKEQISTRAEGTIMVYNTNTSASQRLIKNTRFESPDGLIFRIEESIEVPSASTDRNGKVTPGSVVAEVFADGTGEQYNIGPSRFTIPGLKDTEQYDSMYGESNTAFSGGFEGEKYLIDEAELSTAQQSLQIELRDKLLLRLKEERPAGFVLYDNAITFTFESLPSTEYGESLATIKERARLQVPLFKEDEFASFIAARSVPDYDDGAVTIPKAETLEFSYLSATTTHADIASFESLSFLLKGDARIVWTFNEEELKRDLLSKNKTEAAQVFSSYSAIANAQAEVRPFWESSFPSSPQAITVTTVLEETP